MRFFEKFVKSHPDFLSKEETRNLLYAFHCIDEHQVIENCGNTIVIKELDKFFHQDYRSRLDPLIKKYCNETGLHSDLEYYGADMNWYTSGSVAAEHYDDEFVWENGTLKIHPLSILIFLGDSSGLVFPEHDKIIEAKNGTMVMFPANHAFPHFSLPEYLKGRYSIRIKYVRKIYETHTNL